MKLCGTLPVIPTPLRDNKVDYESLERLLAHLFPALEGCTILGGTGECASLTLPERLEVTRFVLANAPKDKAIVVGISHTSLPEMIALGQAAAEEGAAGVLVSAPYYFPNSFPMLCHFLQQLDAALEMPLVLYDNPYVTKTFLRTEELLRLAEACPHLRHVKITDLDLSKIPRLKAESDLGVFCGEDAVTFRSLLLGVDGSMIIVPSIFPRTFQEVVRLLAVGDRAGAFHLYCRRVLPLIHLLGLGEEIANAKAIFHYLGLFRTPEVRPPLLPASPERRQELILAYEECCAEG